MSSSCRNWLPLILLSVLIGCVGAGAPRPETEVEPRKRRPPEERRDRQVMAILRSLPSPLWKRDAYVIADSYNIEIVLAWEIPSLDSPCAVYQVPRWRSVEDTVTRLEADHRVEIAQPVNFFRVLEDGYNDAHFHLQHAVRSLGVERAHRWATGRGVRVAVVDTGVDFSHPDLEGRIVAAHSVLEGDKRSFTGDIHGTAIAGVIGARANNREGIVGVAPDAQILALKACWETTEGTGQALCNSYTLARAIDVALEQEARVLNLSLAGPEDPIVRVLLNKALEEGVAVVAAVDESEDSELAFPASIDGVIAVGTSDFEGQLLTRAGVSPAAQLVAPGIDILSTVPRESYDFLTGSSLAAAHTTGVVALLLERNPELKPTEVQLLLWATAAEKGSGSNPHGSPREVNACAAMAQLVGEEPCIAPQ